MQEPPVLIEGAPPAGEMPPELPQEPAEIPHQPCIHLVKIREQKMIIRNLKKKLSELNEHAYKLELENIDTRVDLPFSKLSIGLYCISTSLFAAALFRTSDNAVKNRLAITLAACQVIPFLECVTFARKFFAR